MEIVSCKNKKDRVRCKQFEKTIDKLSTKKPIFALFSGVSCYSTT